MPIDVDAHRAGIRRAIRLLFASGMQPKQVPGLSPEQQGMEMREAWLLLLGPRVSGPEQYLELARAYANDPAAADPKFGQKWPTPAVLQTYLPSRRPSLDMVLEFDWLANLSRIRAHSRWDPVAATMVLVSAEDQMRAQLEKRYGPELPIEVEAGLREVGWLQGLKARLRLERDVPYVRRDFVDAATDASKQHLLMPPQSRRPPRASIEAITGAAPLRLVRPA